jgi:hypothetical protein
MRLAQRGAEKQVSQLHFTQSSSDHVQVLPESANKDHLIGARTERLVERQDVTEIEQQNSDQAFTVVFILLVIMLCWSIFRRTKKSEPSRTWNSTAKATTGKQSSRIVRKQGKSRRVWEFLEDMDIAMYDSPVGYCWEGIKGVVVIIKLIVAGLIMGFILHIIVGSISGS